MATDPPRSPVPRSDVLTFACCQFHRGGGDPYAGCTSMEPDSPPRPTFNHTREDSPLVPCRECASLMSPAELAHAYRAALADLVESMMDQSKRRGEPICDGDGALPCCVARRVLLATAGEHVEQRSPNPADNGWTEANECDACRGKPGAPELCALCLERRALKVGDLIREPSWLTKGMRVKTHGGAGCEAILIERPEDRYWTTTDRGMHIYDDSFEEYGVVFLGWTDPGLLKATRERVVRGPVCPVTICATMDEAVAAFKEPSSDAPVQAEATVGLLLETLESDRFRYSLHDWMRDRRDLDRSATDTVTDLLCEIAKRLRVVCAGKPVAAAGEDAGRPFPLSRSPLCLALLDNACPCWLDAGHRGDCVCVCQVKARREALQGDPLTLPAGGQVGRAP